MDKHDERLGCILLFIAGVLWGIVGLCVKELEHAGAGYAVISFLRVFFACIIMAVITVIRYGPKVFKIDLKAIGVCAMLGIVCHGIYNIFYSLAITHAGVSVSAVLLNIAPVFTLIFSVIFFQEKFTKIKLFAVIINMLGCVLTATNGQIDFQTFSLLGILCGIGSGLCYSMTAIIGRLGTNRTNPFVMSTYSYLFAALFLFIWMRPWSEPFTVTVPILLWGFFYGLIPTGIAYLIYYCGIRKVRESSKAPVIASVETVVSALVGIGVYHEKLGVVSFIGFILVLLSIAVMNIKPNKSE